MLGCCVRDIDPDEHSRVCCSVVCDVVLFLSTIEKKYAGAHNCGPLNNVTSSRDTVLVLRSQVRTK